MPGLSSLLLSLLLSLAAVGDVLLADALYAAIRAVPEPSPLVVEAEAFEWYQSPTVGRVVVRGWKVRLDRPAAAANAAGFWYQIADGDLILFATVEDTGAFGPRRYRLTRQGDPFPEFYAPTCSAPAGDARAPR